MKAEAEKRTLRFAVDRTAILQKFADPKSRARIAIGCGLAAMLLIFLSELFPAGTSDTKPAAEVSRAVEEAAYKEQLEQQLTGLIEEIQGAGKATVMLTLENGEETVYALDTQSGQTQSQQTHVLLDDGSALAQTVYLPRVCGAAVVCEGGGDIRVAARITELVSALLDLSTNRICVEQRKE